jgi:hypothetical protein
MHFLRDGDAADYDGTKVQSSTNILGFSLFHSILKSLCDEILSKKLAIKMATPLFERQITCFDFCGVRDVGGVMMVLSRSVNVPEKTDC